MTGDGKHEVFRAQDLGELRLTETEVDQCLAADLAMQIGGLFEANRGAARRLSREILMMPQDALQA